MLIVFAVLSCKRNKTERDTKIVSFEAVFISALTETLFDYSCENLYNGKPHKIFIDNQSQFFDSLSYFIRQLKVDNDSLNSIDGRICCIITYSNNEQSCLLLGGFWGTVYNGKKMEDYDDLAYYIKKNIGFYQYYYFDRLSSFKELNKSRLNEIEKTIKKKRYLKDVKTGTKDTMVDTGLIQIHQW